MRQGWTLLPVCLIVLAMLSGCAGAPADEAPREEHLTIVAAAFPEYDWLRQILGAEIENTELTMLLDNGVDLHSYQPSADDIIRISTCDLFVYTGGVSSSWVDAALAEAINGEMLVVDLMEVLVQDAADAEHVHDAHCEEHGHDGHGTDDEHIWLSLKNASVLCTRIAEQLCVADPENAAVYTENTQAYTAQLDALDRAYQSAVESGKFDTLLFADRFPFRCLEEDYGLSCHAAFPGCSAESEADFETIAFLSGKMDELELPGVLTIDGSDQSLAQTVLRNTREPNRSIWTLDSMQSVTAGELEDGLSYLSVMENNLRVLKNALNGTET